MLKNPGSADIVEAPCNDAGRIWDSRTIAATRGKRVKNADVSGKMQQRSLPGVGRFEAGGRRLGTYRPGNSPLATLPEEGETPKSCGYPQN
jgi:hypothetical protein